MISVRLYGAGGDATEIDPARISDIVGRADHLVWVDVDKPSDADLECLRNEFSLNQQSIDAIRHRHKRAILTPYPAHTFIMASSAGLQEVDFFVTATWLISVREGPGKSDPWPIDAARERFERTRPDRPSSAYLLYVLLDEIVDGYFDFLDRGEDKLEVLEERIFNDPPPRERAMQQELIDARKRLIAFRRAALPLREVLHQLQDRDLDWIDEENGRNFGVAFDHLLRALDLLDAQRELLASVVDAQLAIVSNRMNSVMKKMTSWGAILLVSTLVTGVYGMNFTNIPLLTWRYGYHFALGLMVAISLAGYWYFKRKEWL